MEDWRSLLPVKPVKIVVLDDDPTGSQTVHGCPLLLRWDPATLDAGLDHPSPLLFLLANTRALAPAEARARVRQIALALAAALERARHRGTVDHWLLVSRGDSTLRGHFPLEVEELAAVLGPFDATLLVPAFLEGGRTTVDGVHRLHGRPVHESAFARDALFGYSTSDLPAWVEERSGGRLPAAAVRRLGLAALEGDGAELRRWLASLSGNTLVAVDAERPQHLQALAAAVRALAAPAPASTDPGATNSFAKDPDATDSRAADPVATDPGATDPGSKDPGSKDSGAADPVDTDPGASDPGTRASAATDPDAATPGVADPGAPGTSAATAPAAAAAPGAVAAAGATAPSATRPRRFLAQSAAGLPAALAALPPQPRDAAALAALRCTAADGTPRPGLVLVGSHVPLTDAQLERLLAAPGCRGVELSVARVLRVLEGPLPDRLLASLEAAWLEGVEAVLAAGLTPVLFTSRGEVRCRHAAERRALGLALAGLMARIGAALAPRLGYLISKGGITTHTLLADGLALARVELQGQLLPGLSLVLAPVSAGRALPVITFPGNLGDADSLRQAWAWMERGRPDPL